MVIISDKTCEGGYDIKIKPNDPKGSYLQRAKTKKNQQVRLNVRVLLIIFSDFIGVVHYRFLPYDRKVNNSYYMEIMHQLRETIRRKRLELWNLQLTKLHHDNAPAHASVFVREFLYKNNTLMMH